MLEREHGLSIAFEPIEVAKVRTVAAQERLELVRLGQLLRGSQRCP